ncbi:MAG: acetolactate synthase, large subunit, biosynthetic type [Acidobacteria bacterium 13_1_20CM_2_57_8]|jgi:acetolactate synthase I/II/III large subunit|nr:MAG: acetolactate synthase, large subunit, biosynthetic type [Acidobacteria bacterium 13_1_20CM_2_57_8]
MSLQTELTSPSRHPLAGQTMTGADMIIQVLAEQGVEVMFGYSGGAILPTWDALARFNIDQESKRRKPIELVVPANEQGAGFMAAGYARASGRVGVSMVTSGPGATNSVTPIRDCMADSVPIVLICGQVPRHAIGTDAFQEAPVFNIMSACAKRTFLVLDPEELEATVRTAFEIARSDRPGPVVLDIPKDVQNWKGTFRGEGLLELRGYRERMQALYGSQMPEAKSAAFFDILRKSQRPLIYAGGGVIKSDAARDLKRFATTFQIPVVTTLQGIGSFDTTHPLSLHMLGMHGTAFANYAVEDCDFLIAVGARFDDRVAGNVKQFAPNATNIAHIDIDAAEIGKVKQVTWSHVADSRSGLQDLIAAGSGFKKDFSPWLSHVAELRKNHPLNYDRECDFIQPHYVLECLNRITRGEAIICTGVGQHQMWAAQYLDYKNPRSFLTSGSMGTMGFGLPASIGAQFACPEKLVINVDGDGSLRMNIGELETVTNYNLKVKTLLFNNQGDGMVRQWQKMYFSERFCGTEKFLHRKDFVNAAKADGFEFAQRLSEKNRVESVLQEFVHFDGPAFLEVMIDPDACVFPMIGPGLGYKDIVTGPYITARTNEPAKPPDKNDLF